MCAFHIGVKRTHACGVAHAINISTVAMPHFRVCSVITEIRKNTKKPGVNDRSKEKSTKKILRKWEIIFHLNIKIHSIRRCLRIRKVRKNLSKVRWAHGLTASQTDKFSSTLRSLSDTGGHRTDFSRFPSSAGEAL